MYELYIEGFKVDIDQKISVSLNYAIDDIAKFGSRETSFSKTIVLPGTGRNNQIFGFIYDLGSFNYESPGAANIGAVFNVAQTSRAELRLNGLLVLRGVFRITNIVKDKDIIEYEGAIFGELSGFISEIGNKKLEILDFSAYNHNLTRDNIVNSWNTINGSGYYYPLIDYGTYSTNKVNYNFRTFRPALYVKEYIDKIFENAGYTYESNFMDSAFFKKLIIPNNTKDYNILTKDQLKAQIDDDNYTTYQSFSIQNLPGIVGSAWQSDPKFYNGFTTINGTNFIPSDQTLGGGEEYPNSILTYNGAVSTYVKGRVTFRCEFFNDYDGFFGSPSSPYVTLNFNVVFDGFGDNLGVKTYGAYTTSLNKWKSIDIDYEFEGQLDPNKQFKIYFERQGNWTSTRKILVRNILCNVTIESINAIPTPIVLNNPIDLNIYIPRNILQKDFFTWVMKMFNLYITEDKQREKHLLIEPYVDYFDLTQSIDWTHKVARDKPWTIKPMGMLNGRFFEYKFKDDNDYYNENYKKKFNQNYGDRLEDTGFQYAKDRQTVEIGFSPTVLVEYANTDKIVPSIHKKTKGNSVDQEERMDSNIRILMAKKITGVATWRIINGSFFSNNSLGDALTAYGYAGHFDDPINPTKDINFGAASEIYFDPATYTTNNLFNDYWSGYIAEIADKDSKILSCYVHLTPLDIQQLDFSIPILIDGIKFRLNKIEDYDYTNNELVKVELLKIINNG
jgi:hypothetical protein